VESGPKLFHLEIAMAETCHCLRDSIGHVHTKVDKAREAQERKMQDSDDD
jgi:hypothetical protein